MDYLSNTRRSCRRVFRNRHKEREHCRHVGNYFALWKEPHLAHELASKRHLEATTPKPKKEVQWNPDDPDELPSNQSRIPSPIRL